MEDNVIEMPEPTLDKFSKIEQAINDIYKPLLTSE